MERLQQLISSVQKECPYICGVACFMQEKMVALQVFVADPDEKQEDHESQEEDDVMEKDPMDNGAKYMFLYHVNLEEEDWSMYQEKIIDKYNSLIEKHNHEDDN